MKYDNSLVRMRLLSEPNFFEIYALSLRHTNQSLFKIFIKNRPYIEKLMTTMPPPRREEPRPPRRVEQVNYIYIYKI